MDESNEVAPHNHPNFQPDCAIIRRVSRDLHVIEDKNRGCMRISTALYKYDDPAGYLSCDSATCIDALQETPEKFVMASGRWDGAVHMSVADFRSVERPDDPFKIGMVPLPDNPCHGGVWGKITRGQANALLATSNWLVPISDVKII